jgi:two-component system, OmpR family, sensor histidine kinase KdpD
MNSCLLTGILLHKFLMLRFLMTRLDIRKQMQWSFIAVFLVSAICFAFSSYIDYRVVAFLLLLTVSLIAVCFDIVPVLFSAILSASIWNFFFIKPLFTFHVHTTEDAILFIMYFVIALINGILTYKIRQVEKAARLKEERANSVKLYNTILNSLSHELRTPLAAIIGATDNLQQNANLSPFDKQQLISEISKASLRLNQQVENLLNISRLESGHIQPKPDWCDITELVHEIVTRVEENNPKRKIHISIRQDIPICYIDKGMLDQVLYNLLNNAAIHSDPDVPISISAQCVADLLEFIIEDGGKGLNGVNPEEVFNKFSREQSLKAGSGLGLSIVKGFTEALGGSVHLDAGENTKFIITFPVKTSFINSK